MILPARPASDHGVDYGQQLAHAGDQRHLFRLTGRDKPDIKATVLSSVAVAKSFA